MYGTYAIDNDCDNYFTILCSSSFYNKVEYVEVVNKNKLEVE